MCGLFGRFRQSAILGDEGAMPWGLEALRENHAARLQVHVLENMNLDYKQLVFSHH